MNPRAIGVGSGLALVAIAIAILLFRAVDPPVNVERAALRPDDASSPATPTLNPVATDPAAFEHEEVLRSAIPPSDWKSIAERPSVVIRVVDESGTPVPDSPVAWGRSTSLGLPPYRASTDPRGEIELDASELDALFEDHVEERLVVASLEAVGDAYRIERSRVQAEAEGIQFRVPMLAYVVVECVEGGNPLVDRVDVTLEARVPGESLFETFRPVREAPGRSVFLRIPVGRELVARANFLGRTLESSRDPPWISVSGSNPPIRIDFPPLARISFRAFASTGALLRHERLQLRCEADLPIGQREFVDLDAEGRGQIGWPLDREPGTEPALTLTHSAPGETRARIEVPLSGRLVRGVVELGDLRLLEVPVSWAGSVRGRDGAPIRGATVVVLDSRLARIEDSITDESGRFALRTESESEGLRIEVRAEGFLPSVRTLEREQRNLLVELARPGKIVGRLAEKERQAAPFTILGQIEPLDDPGGARTWRYLAIEVERDGTFVVADLPTGRVSLHLQRTQGSKFVEIRDLAVREDEVTIDPRLQNIEVP